MITSKKVIYLYPQQGYVEVTRREIFRVIISTLCPYLFSFNIEIRLTFRIPFVTIFVLKLLLGFFIIFYFMVNFVSF